MHCAMYIKNMSQRHLELRILVMVATVRFYCKEVKSCRRALYPSLSAYKNKMNHPSQTKVDIS